MNNFRTLYNETVQNQIPVIKNLIQNVEVFVSDVVIGTFSSFLR